MARLVPLVTILPTIFTFIAVILINVGGVNPGSSTFSSREKNSDFSLVNWNYTITPTQSYSSYNYHIYLNRVCSGSQGTQSSLVSELCRNSRFKELKDGKQFTSPNALVYNINPFRFSDVHLNIPFAFYTLTAITAVLLMIMGLYDGASSRSGRVSRLFALIVCAFSFIFILIASAVITWQMLRLKHQIINYTIRTRYLASTTLGSSIDATTAWTTTIQSVKLGKTVLGLTWASVLAMFIEMWMWGWALIRGGEKRNKVEMKGERYVQG